MFLLDYLNAYDWRKYLTSQIQRDKREDYVFPPRDLNSRRSPSEQACFHDKIEGRHKGHEDEGRWVLYFNGQLQQFGPLEVLVAKTPYPEFKLFGFNYNVYLRKIAKPNTNSLESVDEQVPSAQ